MRVLKDVGERGLVTAASVRDDRMLGPVVRDLIWRDSLGLLGGLRVDIMLFVFVSFGELFLR